MLISNGSTLHTHVTKSSVYVSTFDGEMHFEFPIFFRFLEVEFHDF